MTINDFVCAYADPASGCSARATALMHWFRDNHALLVDKCGCGAVDTLLSVDSEMESLIREAILAARQVARHAGRLPRIADMVTFLAWLTSVIRVV